MRDPGVQGVRPQPSSVARTAGTRIVEKLGGMGMVHKAEDTRSHGFVALKFLPEVVARDPQALGHRQRTR